MSNYDELLSKMTRKTEDKANSNDVDERANEKPREKPREKSREKRRDRRRNRSEDASDNESDEKFASTLDREEIDYYKILGVSEDANAKTIKRAYYKRLRKYHPDNLKDKSDKVAVRKNKEKYELINEAYNLLKDEYRRKAYDTGKKFDTKSKGFESQKDSFKDFLKLQEQNMTAEDRKLAKLKFDMSKKELNSKHGYDEEKEDIIEKEEFNRRFDDLVMQREQEEVAIQHDNMFEGRQFNPSEFNKMFEKKKRRDAKRGSGKEGGIVPVGEDGIMAFNDGMDSNFAGIDSYSDLYATGNYGGASDNFAGLGAGMIGGEGSDSDELSIDSNDIEDTYDTHNKGASKEVMDDMFQRAMAEREMQDDKFEHMLENDEYGSAMDDKYGISKDFGFMVGNDSKFGGHQSARQQNRSKRGTKDKNRVKAQYEAYKELTDK
jgi:curved DNA-binding protein CbpA